MKGMELAKALGEIDDAILESAAAPPKARLRHPPVALRRWAALAACLCLLLIGGAFFWQLPESSAGDDFPGFSLPPSDMAFPGIGSSPSMMPPPKVLPFPTDQITVEARIVRVLPDLYRYPTEQTLPPTAISPVVHAQDAWVECKVLEMETLEVLQGEGMPDRFYLLLPTYQEALYGSFDSLILAMTQVGAENMQMYHVKTGKTESFFGPVFRLCNMSMGMHHSFPCVLPFTDGVFDTRLWEQTKQTGFLQTLEKESEDQMVGKGWTVEQCKERFRQKCMAQIREYTEKGMVYRTPQVYMPDPSDRKVKKALRYLQPFRKGTFYVSFPYGTVQSPYSGETEEQVGTLRYRRYIDGIPSDEWVEIHPGTGKVERSAVRYTRLNLWRLPDMAAILEARREEIAGDVLPPPHLDIEGKIQEGVYACAWYCKAGHRSYGILMTVWLYGEEDGSTVWYDVQYELFPAGGRKSSILSPEELMERFGYTSVLGSGDPDDRMLPFYHMFYHMFF